MRAFLVKSGAMIAASSIWIARAIRRASIGTRDGVARIVRTQFAHGAARFAVRSARIALITACVTGVLLLSGWIGFHRVAPGTIGVRQVNFGGGGIVREDFASGLHFAVKGLHSWHAIDGRTQMISYGWSAEPYDAEHLKVRTADGNYVRIGLAVPFRVLPGEAHALVEDGLKSTYRQRVQTAVEKVLSTEFGRLATEQFWDTDRRTQCIVDALPRLNRELSALHVEALDILVENFRFNPEYENRLQQVQLDAVKQIVDKTKAAVDVEQNKIDRAVREIERSESELGIELKRQIDTESDAGRKRIEAKLAEARYYDQTRKAEAALEFERLVAEGERLVAQVEQLRISAENEGYGSRGGRLLLARRAAENLKVKQVTLNSNDPRSPSVLDLDALTALLVGSAK